MQIAWFVAITREKLSGDFHGLPCIGRKAGKKDAACLSWSSKGIEARGNVGEEFRYHFSARMGGGALRAGQCKRVLLVSITETKVQTWSYYL